MEDTDPGSKRNTLRDILRSLRSGKRMNDAESTEQEILKAVTEGQEQGVLLESEADMISNIFALTDKEAKDIMTHRNEIVAIDGNMTLSQAVRFLMEESNSRFPVWTDSIDHIIGILHRRDVLKFVVEGGNDDTPIRKLRGLLRTPAFVTETRNVESLFRSMQEKKTQIVIIIDEYGQTAGLVSMEGILEEIVGNIFDEYDEEEDYIRMTEDTNEFIIDGKTPLEDLTERLGITFEGEDAGYETVNGLLIARLDHIPADDETFETDIDGYHFKVLSAGNHMIRSVLVSKEI